MIVYIDLDRTLFKVDAIGTLWRYIRQQYPEIGDDQTDPEAFYHYVDDLYYYDMSAHMSAVGLDPATVYMDIATSSFADGRFEYDGAKELIDALIGHGFDVRVLTFGSDDYQRFKASLCPSVRGLPIITTLRPKPEVLEDFEEGCWLIDDKPLGDELPNNVSFVQVNLEGENGTVLPDAVWPIKQSLHDVKLFFDAVV